MVIRGRSASQMYAKNVTNLVRPMIKDGALRIDTSDELARETLGLSAPTPA